MRKFYLIIFIVLLFKLQVVAQCVSITSTSGNPNQSVCINTPINAINYTYNTSVTGLIAFGLPAGIDTSTSQGIFTISGTPNVAGTFNYAIISYGSSCGPGDILQGKLEVNAPPALTGLKAFSICSNTNFNYSATSSIPNTSITWQRAAVTGISNQPGLSTGNVINETLINTTSQPVNVTYVFSLQRGSCAITDSVIVTVNPTPVIDPVVNYNYCNGTTAAAIFFSSVSPGSSFTWTSDQNIGFGTNGTGSIPSFIAINTSNLPVMATVKVAIKASSNNCFGDTATFMITVLPAPTLTSTKAITVCNDETINYIATSSSATSTTFAWQRAFMPEISNPAGAGTGPLIGETLHNNSTNPVNVQYVFTLSTGTGCNVTETVTVTVNPTLTIIPLRDTSFCNGSNVANGIPINSNLANAIYAWTNANTAIGLPASGNGSLPAFTVLNSGSSAVNSLITVSITTAGGCIGQAASFNITVLPGPTLTSSRTVTICNNSAFSYNATSSASNTVFSWSRALVQGISNQSGSGNSGVVNEVLNNTTETSLVVTYAFTLSTGTGCIQTNNVAVTVNPSPKLDSLVNQVYCNGSPVIGIAFKSNSPDSSFTWTSSQSVGFGTNGTGSISSFIASNPTSVPIVATVNVSVLTGVAKCPGQTRSFTITVLPGPIMTSSKTASTCNDSVFRYTISASTANTNFNWVRNVVTGISNARGSGSTAAIRDTLHNTTSNPISVTYIITLFTGNTSDCVTTDTLLVTVNPTPVINPPGNRSYCNGTPVTGIRFSGIPATTSFSWTCSPSIGFGTNGSDSIPTFTATNPTNAPIVATVTVSPRVGANNCPGQTITFTITVLPGPTMTGKKSFSICNNSNFSYTASSSAANTTFNWRRENVPGIINPTTNVQSAVINESLNNSTNAPVLVKYLFTLSTGAGNGCITLDSVMLTVNPTPVIANLRDTSFCNGVNVNGISFITTPSSSLTWTSSSSLGFGLSGSSNIPAFNASNPGSIATRAVVTVSIFIDTLLCRGGDKTFAITVLPTPSLSSAKTASVCNNVRFNYTATSPVLGTAFSWERSTVAGISNSGKTGSSNIIDDTLRNTTQFPIRVTYKLFLSVGNNCNRSDSLVVTVNPTPIINAVSNFTICYSDTLRGIQFSSTSPDSSFRWTSIKSIGFGLNGTGSIPTFIADNRSNTPVVDTVKVTVTASSDNCPGIDTAIFTVTVLPTPALTSPKTAMICDSAIFNYTATSFATNTNFGWTRPAVSGISNLPGSGSTATINERLNNTTDRPLDVLYLLSLSTGSGLGCVRRDTVRVTVNPSPKVNAIANVTYCNGIRVNGINFSSTTPDATYAWTANPGVGFGSSGTANISFFTATNNNSTALTSTIIVTAGINGCRGVDTMVFNITVNPSPTKPSFTSLSRYADYDTLPLCAGSNNINFNITQQEIAVRYEWLASSTNITIRDKNDANTVASFNNSGLYTMKVIATESNNRCTDSATQVVRVSTTPGIDERGIILKQPGNLLIYPDNSLNRVDGYQWGYDSLLRTTPDTAFSSPKIIAGQLYQYMVPEARFIQNNQLDTARYAYWVLLKSQECISRVYYNGPYAVGRLRPLEPELENIEVKVYPNPNNGVFSISVSGNIYGSLQANIYNGLGQPVVTSRFAKTTTSINHSFSSKYLPDGIYYLVINSSDLKKAQTRFIIKH